MRTRWVVACATAETVGIAAAAAAARSADSLSPGLGFAVVVAGGLVEGAALGLLQAAVLGPVLGRARQQAWALLTVLVAGVGWAAGSAPATLGGGGNDADRPALGIVLLVAAALGLGLGAVLGSVQAVVLRQRVRHPWRWVPANALGWAVAMTVVFGGATTAGSGWDLPTLVAYGAVTGAVAGTLLGVVTGTWLGALDGPPLRHRLVLAALVARSRPATAGLTALAVTGARSGHTFRFPVMCAPMGGTSLVVLPGHADRKTWWHQIHDEPSVEVLDRGRWVPARAAVLEHGSLGWAVARAAYRDRWRRTPITDEPLVVVELGRDEGPVGGGQRAVGARAASS